MDRLRPSILTSGPGHLASVRGTAAHPAPDPLRHPHPIRPAGMARLARRLVAAGLTLALAACALPAPAQDTSALSGEEPPARVGRVSIVEGDVTLSDGTTEWSSPLNWPVTSGRSLRTGTGSRAEARIGSMAVRLDADTLVDFTRVDDRTIGVVVQWGAVGLRVRNREMLSELDLTTQRERITLEDVGRYRIDVDRVDGVTGIATLLGAARVQGAAFSFTVGPGERIEVSASPVTRLQQLPVVSDAFDDWTLALDRRDDVLRSTQYVSAEMTGVESLDSHGRWRVVDEYGPVWFPTSTPIGWVPYRHGRWAHVAPWGWTWIDEAPWGFAPFHYGRWVYTGGTWGWVPGRPVPRPVYAPALVAWVGAAGGGVTIGTEPVGWFPLAPWDVYAPPYRHPRHHWDAHNGVWRGVRPMPPMPYRNPTTVTWVPPGALRSHAPVPRVITAPPPRWVSAPPVIVAPPVIAPTVPAMPVRPTPGRRPGEEGGPTKRHPTNPTGESSVTRAAPDRPQPPPHRAPQWAPGQPMPMNPAPAVVAPPTVQVLPAPMPGAGLPHRDRHPWDRERGDRADRDGPPGRVGAPMPIAPASPTPMTPVAPMAPSRPPIVAPSAPMAPAVPPPVRTPSVTHGIPQPPPAAVVAPPAGTLPPTGGRPGARHPGHPERGAREATR